MKIRVKLAKGKNNKFNQRLYDARLPFIDKKGLCHNSVLGQKLVRTKGGIRFNGVAVFFKEVKRPRSNTFYCQETIGGWRQLASFKGTFDECWEWLGDKQGSWDIVPEDLYEVDYL